MAVNQMKLMDVAENTVSFSPEDGWKREDNDSLSEDFSANSIFYSYNWGTKQKWTLSIELINKTDRDQIITWRQGRTLLDFYPDLINAPATKHSVYIINRNPTRAIPGAWLTSFRADLVLYEA